MNDFLDDPDNFRQHIERYVPRNIPTSIHGLSFVSSMAGAVIMEIVYGHEVKSIDDNFLQIASKGGRTIAAAGAVGAHIVDLIPPREYSLKDNLTPHQLTRHLPTLAYSPLHSRLVSRGWI